MHLSMIPPAAKHTHHTSIQLFMLLYLSNYLYLRAQRLVAGDEVQNDHGQAEELGEGVRLLLIIDS